jgi:hypothetical protein
VLLKSDCQNRIPRKLYEAELYRRRFKLTPNKLDENRGWYKCYSGIYKQFSLGQRLHPDSWKTDTRGFFTGRLLPSTRKCTHIFGTVQGFSEHCGVFAEVECVEKSFVT